MTDLATAATARRSHWRRRLGGTALGLVLALAAANSAASPAHASPAPAQTSAMAAGIGVVEPDGALFVPGTSYPKLASLTAAVVGWTPRPGGGAWEVASDGGVFARQAPFLGSMGGHHLNQPIAGMAATPTGRGYWLVATDGGIFAFGDARFYGSTGNLHLNQPIVTMAATPDGRGYWLVASDGGIFSFGDAQFYGSTGNVHLSQPIVGMASSPDTHGYWLVASDGGIFAFGDAHFYGSVVGRASARVVSITPSGPGYATTLADGSIWQFGAGEPAAEVWRLPIPRSYVIDQAAEQAVSAALAQVGTPYLWGGSQPGGFDCSGLTQFAYAAAGVALPRTAAEQFAAAPPVPLADAQPGDLVFFLPGITHVGIYLGDGLMVDAPHVGGFVRVEAMAPFGPVMGVGRPA